MIVDNRTPIGTKLVWSCETTLYSFETKQLEPVHYYYPCMVVNQSDRHGALIQMPSSRQWMNGEEQYLREPTEQEIKAMAYEYDKLSNKLLKS